MTEKTLRAKAARRDEPLVRRGYPRLKWLLCATLVHSLVRLRIDGRKHLPPPDAGVFVIACNHRSWIDPLAIIATLGPDRPVAFLAAREHIEKRQIMDRLFIWLGGVIKIDRTALNQRTVLRAAAAALEDGMRLALFPEGRINAREQTGVELLPFEPGAAVIARRGDIPIVPFAIAGSDNLHFRRRVTLAIGPALAAAEHHHGDETTTATLRAVIAATLPPEPRQARLQFGKWLGRLV